VIEFRLNERSGVPTYLQLVHQARQAIRLGLLQPGDQLPTVKEVVGALAINPNTVLKAYRELDREGLVEGRPGVGTFVARSLVAPSLASHSALQDELVVWLRRARLAGLDQEDVMALLETTLRDTFLDGSFQEDVA
jgi:GntR family transcriptional regulator